jgi:hypothetical protein
MKISFARRTVVQSGAVCTWIARDRHCHAAAALGSLTLLVIGGLYADRARAQDQAAFVSTPSLQPTQQTAQLIAGLTHTDNFARTGENRASDTVAVVGTNLDLHRRGAEVDLQAQGNADFVDYLSHRFGSRVLGFMNGSALLGAPSDWFQFSARDTFGQLIEDPFEAVTPENLEDVNQFSAGPAVNLHLGDSTRLTGYGIYSRTTYQTSPNDSHAITAGAALARQLSRLSTLTLSVSKQNTVFDDPGNSDFDIGNVELRLDAGTRRTTLAAAIGYTQLKQAGDTSGGPLVLLQASRKVSPFTTLFINVQRDYATSVDALLAASGAAPGLTAAVGSSAPLSTATPFRDQVYGAGFTIDKSRTTLSVTATLRQEHYSGQNSLNRTLEGLGATLTRRLSPTITASLAGELDHGRFDDNSGSDTEYHILASVAKNLTTRLSVSLQYDRYARSGTGGFVPYTENQVGARVTYSIIGL